MQVLPRSTTSARPRVASPEVPVKDAGMASPTTVKPGKVWPRALPKANAAIAKQSMGVTGLAKGIHRDRLEPVARHLRLVLAKLARRIDRAGDVAVEFDELAVPGMIGSI